MTFLFDYWSRVSYFRLLDIINHAVVDPSIAVEHIQISKKLKIALIIEESCLIVLLVET